MSHIANSNIRVDNFQYRQSDKTRYVYFLSHCHEDHLRGLSNNWSHGKIYTSYLSKALIIDRFPGLKDFVVDLEMDEEHWIYVDDDKKEGVQVVLMDAFHCPGAVMFLFKGKMGTVLHTGDFRFAEAMFDNEWLCPLARRNPQFKGITVECDYLHLDNTFANPEYDFPSREEAYQGLINIVKSHKDHRIFLFSYSLGKEEVFLNLANDFKCKIVVDEARMRKIQLMDLKPELFTTDPTQSHIHIRSIRDLKAHDINACNREFPTIFVILTGWNDKYNKNLPFYFKVPYSSHSNYRELERFVKAVNPSKLIFNVHERNDTKKRQEFQSYLSREYERGKSAIMAPNTSTSKAAIAPLVNGCSNFRLTQQSNVSSNYFEPKNRTADQVPKQQQSISSSFARPNQQSLLHPSISTMKQPLQHVAQSNIKVGYQGAVAEMAHRFDVNNRELNKRRFNDQYAHIISASKAKQGAKSGKGSKYILKEVSLSLTPPNELNAGDEHSSCQQILAGSMPTSELQGVRVLEPNELIKEESLTGLLNPSNKQQEDQLKLEDSESNSNSNISRLSAQIGAANKLQIGATEAGIDFNEQSQSSNASQLSNKNCKKRKAEHLSLLAKSFEKGLPSSSCSKRRKFNNDEIIGDQLVEVENQLKAEIGTDLNPSTDAVNSMPIDQNEVSNRLACIEEQRVKEAQQKLIEARNSRLKKMEKKQEIDDCVEPDISKKTTLEANGDHAAKHTEVEQKAEELKKVNKKETSNNKPDKSFLDNLRKQIHQHQEQILKNASASSQNM